MLPIALRLAAAVAQTSQHQADADREADFHVAGKMVVIPESADHPAMKHVEEENPISRPHRKEQNADHRLQQTGADNGQGKRIEPPRIAHRQQGHDESRKIGQRQRRINLRLAGIETDAQRRDALLDIKRGRRQGGEQRSRHGQQLAPDQRDKQAKRGQRPAKQAQPGKCRDCIAAPGKSSAGKEQLRPEDEDRHRPGAIAAQRQGRPEQ